MFSVEDYGPRGPWFEIWPGHRSLWSHYPCLVLVKAVDIQLTWTDCEEAVDYVVPNVLSPRDLVSRPDNMDKTVLHKQSV